jgi:hypothetical protein
MALRADSGLHTRPEVHCATVVGNWTEPLARIAGGWLRPLGCGIAPTLGVNQMGTLRLDQELSARSEWSPQDLSRITPMD